MDERREGDALGPGEDSRDIFGEKVGSYGESERRRWSTSDSVEPSVEAVELGVVGRDMYVSDFARPLLPALLISNEQSAV